jgi:hypothetical protein
MARQIGAEEALHGVGRAAGHTDMDKLELEAVHLWISG